MYVNILKDVLEDEKAMSSEMPSFLTLIRPSSSTKFQVGWKTILGQFIEGHIEMTSLESISGIIIPMDLTLL